MLLRTARIVSAVVVLLALMGGRPAVCEGWFSFAPVLLRYHDGDQAQETRPKAGRDTTDHDAEGRRGAKGLVHEGGRHHHGQEDGTEAVSDGGNSQGPHHPTADEDRNKIMAPCNVPTQTARKTEKRFRMDRQRTPRDIAAC